MMMNSFQFPTQLLQMLKSGNPQQVVMQFLQQNSGNNPMIQNVIDMANNGNQAGIEQVARNLCKSRGIDPDQLMNQLQQKMK